MRERWKGLGDGGFGQIVYSVLAAVCLLGAPMAATISWAGAFVLLAGVFVWVGWFNDD